MQKPLLTLMIALIVQGCSSSQPRIKIEDQSYNRPAPIQKSSAAVQQKLMDHFSQWRGTPYQLGGQSRRGIDCSGFTQLSYRQSLGIELPRTTSLQSTTGPAISDAQRRSGDLVFFKTGWGKQHVGIYLSGDRFMHASTSAGVTISELNNPYWRQRYWKSIRPDGIN
ncbi:NlpC/P60 family protein [Marinobacterium jannaschii]|uniref:NlpC/P60 family protein n=1 Tax=Marinobacterium jannaschii TaxID=64970 RepID=UPI0004864914|nr:NlpC/P60 family protein [Marinobacterium jannaschii]